MCSGKRPQCRIMAKAIIPIATGVSVNIICQVRRLIFYFDLNTSAMCGTFLVGCSNPEADACSAFCNKIRVRCGICPLSGYRIDNYRALSRVKTAFQGIRQNITFVSVRHVYFAGYTSSLLHRITIIFCSCWRRISPPGHQIGIIDQQCSQTL